MIQKQLWTAALSAALAGVMAASAFAQAGPGGPGGPGGAGQPGQRGQMRGMMDSSMIVIRMSTVQRHLELSAAQIERINALPRMGGGRAQPGEAGAGPGGQAGQRRQGQAGAGAAQGGQAGQRRQAGQAQPGAPRPDPLADILSARQMTRFRQLVAQHDSPMSMLRPEHAQRLQLSQEQRQQIMELLRELMPAGGREQARLSQAPLLRVWSGARG